MRFAIAKQLVGIQEPGDGLGDHHLRLPVALLRMRSTRSAIWTFEGEKGGESDEL